MASLRSLVVIPVLAVVVACGGSSAQFLGVPGDDGGADGGSSGNDGSASDGSGGGDGAKGDSSGGDARADVITNACNLDGGPFPTTFVDGCLATDNCIIVMHEATCCGPREAIGINHSARQQFEADEAAWQATCPKCGCPTNPDVIAQDGNTGPAQNVQVKCDLSGGAPGKCRTFFN